MKDILHVQCLSSETATAVETPWEQSNEVLRGEKKHISTTLHRPVLRGMPHAHFRKYLQYMRYPYQFTRLTLCSFDCSVPGSVYERFSTKDPLWPLVLCEARGFHQAKLVSTNKVDWEALPAFNMLDKGSHAAPCNAICE